MIMRLYSSLKTTLVILLLSLFNLSFSQNTESSQINKYSTEQGLSSNFIYCILQDDKGFMWIATEEGLNKFDGKSFSHFAVNSGRYSLSHNRTQTLLLAPDGNIWAGTSDGLNIYDYKSDSIIRVKNNTKPLTLIYNDITYLSQGKDKNITWIGTYGHGVNYYDWKQQKFFPLKLPELKNTPKPRDVMSLLEDDNNRLWIGTQNNGLYRYDIEDKKLTYFSLPVEALYIHCIFQDSFRRIWIGTSKGCYIYNETTNNLDLVKYPEGLRGSSIEDIKEDRSGKIWIGTEQSLLIFSVRSFSLNEHFNFRSIKQSESGSGISCPSIRSIFADKDNNVWIGTAWGGVNMLKGTPSKFRLFKHEPDITGTLPNSPITSLAENYDGTLLVGTMGTDKVGICSLNTRTGEIKPLSINKRFPGIIYQTLFVDSQHNLWIGTYTNGLIKVNQKANNYTQFLYNHWNINSISEYDIRCITETKDHTIWVGTSTGLAYIKNSQVVRLNILKPRTSVRSIQEDNDGTLWIGTYGAGVIKYSTKTKQVNFNPTNFSPKVISNILIHGDSIWIATLGEGLLLYNKLTNKGKKYDETNNLNNNYVRSLARDNRGNIWFGTSKGLSKLNPVTNDVENFNTEDGLQNKEFAERAVAVLPNGLLAFAGYSGLNIFGPAQVKKTDKCPSVVFTRLLISNEAISPNDQSHKTSPISENISLASHIDLKYNQSVFTIEFVGINYNAVQKIQYAYLLDGSDKKWNYIGTQNNLTFRNLSPGEYTLKVKASSPDMVWTDSNIASIKIIVHPPFWRTIWAYLIYLAILSILLYFVWVFFTLRIRAANDIKIERAKREKDEELHQEKLQFFTNISHEFRTPLTLIIGPLENIISEENNENKKIHLNLVLRNAKRMLLMVNQLLDFRKAERGQLKLKVQLADMNHTLSDVIASFNELKYKKNIQLKFDCPNGTNLGWFDPDILSKCIFNLLSNSFKFTSQNGEIILSLKILEDSSTLRQAQIAVSDNGIGIPEDDISQIFDRFYQAKNQMNFSSGSGIGLHFTKTLVELHHGTINVTSLPGVKTTFTITLPVNKQSYNEAELSVESIDESSERNEDELADVMFTNELPDDAEKQIKKKPSNKNKILLVEDNLDMRSYITEILGKEYAVDETRNGVEALNALKENDYDLIISDIMMPEMDGIELCKKIKSSIETDHIPIILLTAKSEIENKIEGLKIGADSYITKPFHPDHLRIRVAKLIELREILKERYGKKISLVDIQHNDENSVSPDELFLQKTVTVILEKMIDSKFNGDALASELCISRMGLHRKIKALTGQSTGEFIRNIRLKKACEYLSTPGKNISEVCYDVGFNSPSYFTTCFTELYKITPSDYAKKMRNKI
jgi:signal transduction histidine kinase/ligand-binding sensor domain-containing protein/DNA-binding response OmpR family regulator